MTEAGLSSSVQVQQLVESLPAEKRPRGAKQLARLMLHQGLLTRLQAETLLQGQALVVGNYLLIDRLGEGGMGVVYKARHTKLDKLVALKVLSARGTDDPERVGRFEHEMKAIGRLEDPHLVRAMDAGQIGQQHFLVMEYVDGLNLSEVLGRAGQLRIADACEMVRQAAQGLRAIDENGLVHRDIKPSNLMLNADGKVKILDLGLAIFSAQTAGEGPGRIVGTPDYMAPEQAQGISAVDIRADMYSLGCTLYKLLAGCAPFSGPKYPTPVSRMMAHTNDPPPPLVSLRADVPAKLAAVVERLLAKDPALRLPSPRQLIDALTPFCGGSDLAGLFARAAVLQRPQTETDTSRAVVQNQLTPSPAPSVAAGPAAGTPATREETFDPYHTWLGIPPNEQPPHHYRLLGLQPFENKREVIESAVARQSAYLRTLQLGPRVALTQRLLNEVSAAKICLLVPEKKTAYDKALRKKLKEVTGDRGQVTGDRLQVTGEQGPTAKDPHPGAAAGSPLSPGGRGVGGEGVAESGRQKAESGPIAVAPVPNPQPPVPPPLPRAPNPGPPAPSSDPRLAARVAGRRRRSPPKWRKPLLIFGGSGAAMLVLGVILSIRTGYGTVRIELSDPQANVEVKIDGDAIELTGLKDPLKIKAGPHDLNVTSGDFQTCTKRVHRQQRPGGIAEGNARPQSKGKRCCCRGSDPKSNIRNPTSNIVSFPRHRPLRREKAKEHQQAWAKHLGVPVETTDAIGMKLVLIPPGEFMMGSPDSDKDARQGEKPQHRVRITKPFYLGRYLVTQEQWEAVMGSNPSNFKGPKNPVEMVNWDDCQQFLDKLNAKVGGGKFSLPTEAQWEYACRAGTTTRYYFGDDESPLGDYAWFNDNSDGMTHPVGEKKPNAWGLYDMHGNVWEWCADWYDSVYYAEFPGGRSGGAFERARTACIAAVAGTAAAECCRSAYRFSSYREFGDPDGRSQMYGFRVARDAAETSGERATPGAAAGSSSSAAGSTGGQTASGPQSPIPNPQSPAPPPAVAPFDASQSQAASGGMGETSGRAGGRHQLHWHEARPHPARRVRDGLHGPRKSPQRLNGRRGTRTGVSAEGPRHHVKITKPFYLGTYPVTQGEYEKVMGVNPSAFTEKQMDVSAPEPPFDQGFKEQREKDAEKVAGKDTSRHPVETISWDDAMEFCRRLSAVPAERTARRVYRLPTEAEWEYACRAGTTSRWYCGDDEAGLFDAAWFGNNALGMTHPVGEKRPNAWGLYDMIGNLRQWCGDWYAKDYYGHSPPDDPVGPPAGDWRVLRGGSWLFGSSDNRSAYRFYFTPASRFANYGFRVAADVAAKEQVGSQPALPVTPGAPAGLPSGAAGSTGGQAASGTQSPIPNPQSPIPPPAIAPFDAAKAKAHQQAWAKHLGVPVEDTNSIGMKLSLIPPGGFEMGSTPEEIAAELQRHGTDKRLPTEGPRHHVKIAKPFYLGTCPVTQAEYKKLMGVNPSVFTEKLMEASAFEPPLDQRHAAERGPAVQEGCRHGHQPPPRGDGELARREGVLPHPFSNARGTSCTAGLSSPDRCGVGIRLPGGNDDSVVLWRRRGRIGGCGVVQRELGRNNAPRGREKAERVGAVRHARERMGVVCRLVLTGILCAISYERSNRPPRFRASRGARRGLARSSAPMSLGVLRRCRPRRALPLDRSPGGSRCCGERGKRDGQNGG